MTDQCIHTSNWLLKAGWASSLLLVVVRPYSPNCVTTKRGGSHRAICKLEKLQTTRQGSSQVLDFVFCVLCVPAYLWLLPSQV